MIPETPTMTVPLYTDEHGAIRVGETRVLLELLIHAYYRGETPEGIVDSYPTLTTADVYAVIGYYLQNREQIDSFVHQRDTRAAQIINEIDASLSPQARELRTRLRAHKEQQRKQS